MLDHTVLPLLIQYSCYGSFLCNLLKVTSFSWYPPPLYGPYQDHIIAWSCYEWTPSTNVSNDIHPWNIFISIHLSGDLVHIVCIWNNIHASTPNHTTYWYFIGFDYVLILYSSAKDWWTGYSQYPLITISPDLLFCFNDPVVPLIPILFLMITYPDIFVILTTIVEQTYNLLSISSSNLVHTLLQSQKNTLPGRLLLNISTRFVWVV